MIRELHLAEPSDRCSLFQTPPIKKLPYNWSTSRGAQAIVAIIAHGTVGRDSRAYLSRGGDLPDGSDKQVSIHVLIQKDGTIYRYVPDSKGANHAGFGTMPAPWAKINPNRCTLGFELENLQDGRDPYTDAQLLSMGWQINSWRATFGALPILRHAQIDAARRKDTVGLSVNEIESWCIKAAAPTHYRATAPMWISERPDPRGPIALQGLAVVMAGERIEVDEVRADGYVHLANHTGFLPIGGLEKI